MLVIVVCHSHAKGFGSLFVCPAFEIPQTYDIAVPLIGHHGYDGLKVVAIYGGGVHGCRVTVVEKSIGKAVIFSVILRLDTYDGHSSLALVFMVAVAEADGLQPRRQATLSSVVLQLAASCLPVGSEDNGVNLVHELIDIGAIGVVVVIDDLEQRVTLSVEKVLGYQAVPPYDGLRCPQIIRKDVDCMRGFVGHGGYFYGYMVLRLCGGLSRLIVTSEKPYNRKTA